MVVQIKCVLDKCVFSYLWFEQDHINTKECELVIHNVIDDIILHSWFIDISSSSLCIFNKLYTKHLDVLSSIIPIENVSMPNVSNITKIR